MDGRQPHGLYRFFDSDGALLYVGITVNLPARLSRHRDEKEWWVDVVRVSIEWFPDRDSVLAAEKAAIRSEQPRYNIQHNRSGRVISPPVVDVQADTSETWAFSSRNGFERTIPLWLYWEVHCDPVSDDFYRDEIDARDLWREWLRWYPVDEGAESVYGPGAFRITWYVEGPGVFEMAPFQDLRVFEKYMRDHPTVWPDDFSRRESCRDFLWAYTYPRNCRTGAPVQWSRLPVIDKIWRDPSDPGGPTPVASKGGFIQEATGWKPSPLQPYVDVYRLGRSAGLYLPERAMRREVGVS